MELESQVRSYQPPRSSSAARLLLAVPDMPTSLLLTERRFDVARVVVRAWEKANAKQERSHPFQGGDS
jgi:hypothetical protein